MRVAAVRAGLLLRRCGGAVPRGSLRQRQRRRGGRFPGRGDGAARTRPFWFAPTRARARTASSTGVHVRMLTAPPDPPRVARRTHLDRRRVAERRPHRGRGPRARGCPRAGRAAPRSAPPGWNRSWAHARGGRPPAACRLAAAHECSVTHARRVRSVFWSTRARRGAPPGARGRAGGLRVCACGVCWDGDARRAGGGAPRRPGGGHANCAKGCGVRGLCWAPPRRPGGH